jgi:hypothetical protein
MINNKKMMIIKGYGETTTKRCLEQVNHIENQNNPNFKDVVPSKGKIMNIIAKNIHPET